MSRPPSHRPLQGPPPGPSTKRPPKVRPLARPRPVHVRIDDEGDLLFVRLPGRPARRVKVVRERWRIDDEWWRTPIAREYRSVVLDDGRAVTLYHDLQEDRWYAQRGA